MYGAHDNFSLADSHVIPGLLHRCALAARDGTPFTVAGSGAPLRQFMCAFFAYLPRFTSHALTLRVPALISSYAPDLARLLLAVLRRYSSFEPLILSVDPSDEASIADVARAIAAAMRFQGDIVFDTARADGQLRKTACNDRLKAALPDALGPKGFTPLAEGLAATAAWFTANFPNVRT